MTDEKFCALFDERIKSHLQDGYFPVVLKTTGTILYARLRHRTNCNIIKIWGFLDNYQLEQWTNDRLKFLAKY